jgi:regulator of protease activity HflC (stomatin/prohibitin superfamily)
MRLSKEVSLAGCIIASLLVTACGAAKPDAGEQAVLIRKPYFFGHGGVVPTPVTTGRQYVALSTQVVYVNMQPLQYEEKFDDLMSSDGIPLGFDSIMRIQITDSVDLIKNFGIKFYETNIQNEFRNRVRQAVRKHGMNETAISTTAIDAIDAEVTQQMEAYLRSAHMPIRLIKITVGKANPPDAIKDQRIKTAQEQQRQITEVQTKIAEDARKAAEAARADADNAYRQSLGLSAEQFVQIQAINMQRDVCTKSACTFITGNATPVVHTGR